MPPRLFINVDASAEGPGIRDSVRQLPHGVRSGDFRYRNEKRCLEGLVLFVVGWSVGTNGLIFDKELMKSLFVHFCRKTMFHRLKSALKVPLSSTNRLRNMNLRNLAWFEIP